MRPIPRWAAAQAVAEAWRNITATGARPLAVTDNMNFGNPEQARDHGPVRGRIRGMAAACRALDFPVVSGNVSLYNETEGARILPTPAIGGLGVLDDAATRRGHRGRIPGLSLVLLGRTAGWLGPVALAARDRRSRGRAAAAGRFLAAERRNGDFVRARILAGSASQACHDVSDGGLLVAVAEMAMAGEFGCSPWCPHQPASAAHGFWFGEDQSAHTCWRPPTRTQLLARAAGGRKHAAALRLGKWRGRWI